VGWAGSGRPVACPVVSPMRVSVSRLSVIGGLAVADVLDRVASAGNWSPRLRDHPEDARRLAELCAGLPLTLQILAALLAASPSKPVLAMTMDLQNEAGRAGGDDLRRPGRPCGARRLLRAAPRHSGEDVLNPGPDFSAATAAVVGWSEAEAWPGGTRSSPLDRARHRVRAVADARPAAPALHSPQRPLRCCGAIVTRPSPGCWITI